MHRVALPAATALALLVLAGTAGCGSGGGEASDDAVAFGVLAPLSGPSAVRGQDLLDGARLAADDLNVRGGVIGRELTLVHEDDGCSASGGAAAARKLAATDNVAGVVGAVCDASAAAAARALGPGRVPFLVVSASSPSILSPTGAPSTYLLNGTPYQEALAVAHWLALRGAQRLAVVGEDTPHSAFLVRKLVQLTPPVPKVVSRQDVPPGRTDLAAAAGTALEAKPDVVYWAGSAAGGGRLVAALRRAGFNGTFVASAESESPAFVVAAGGESDGAFVVAPALARNLPGGAAWTERFTAAYGHAPGPDALLAYGAVRTLAQAIAQTGEVNRARNSAQLPRLDLEFTTLLGPVQFALDHTIQEDNHIILVVRKGTFRTASTLRSDRG